MAAKSGKKTVKVAEPQKSASKARLFNATLGNEVPRIITQSLAHLRETAMTEEGLFRISGQVEEVQRLKEKWEAGKDFDLSKFSPHCVAGTMKLYLRELPEPLLSYQFYSAFITTDAITNNDSRIASVRKLLTLLPRTNCDILRLVMEFFHDMLQHKATTKMTSANLAIIIAPNILRCRTESVHQIMRDAPHVQSVIRCMIDDFPALFDRPIEPAQRRRTVHDFTGSGGSQPELLPATRSPSPPPPPSRVDANNTNSSNKAPPPPIPAAAAAATTNATLFSGSTAPPSLKLTIAEASAPAGLFSPRIQEIAVEIAPSVPVELRAVLQRLADQFIALRTSLQKATHSSVLAALMHLLVACSQVADGVTLPEGQGLPVQVSAPPATDAMANEAQLLKDMLKHFFVTVHKRVASLARTTAKAGNCPPAEQLCKLLDTFLGGGAPSTPPQITFVALRTVLLRYLDDLAHRLCFLQIELNAPGKDYASLLTTLTSHMAAAKGVPAEATPTRPLLDVLATLQADLAERQRELLEDTILLPDEAGLRRLFVVAGSAVAMRRELVRALDQPADEESLRVPTPKNEGNLYSVRSDAMKLLHRIQHQQLPALRKELSHTTSEQRSMAIGQIVRCVKAALDQPEGKRDFLKEKVIADSAELVADEDRARLQTLQEVIGFVFVAVEGALSNLRADLDSAAYEATATTQLLVDIEAYLALNLDPTLVNPTAPNAKKASSVPALYPAAGVESEQLSFLRRGASVALDQLQEDLNLLRSELEGTQLVMLALAISKLGNVLKKLMNGEAVEESQFVSRPTLVESSDSKELDKLEALKKLTFLTFDKCQAFIVKQRSALQNAKTEAEINDVDAVRSQLRRVLDAFK